MREKDYPKSLLINGEYWKIRFVNKLPGCLGECDPSEMEIRIKRGLGSEERLKTFLHEAVHAMEFSYNFQIKHSHVYKLENGMFDLLVDLAIKSI